MGASIRDVADAAGVSPTTVSHVLSGNRPVSPALTARVKAAMLQLGYAPMRSARNLALGRTQLIGLLVPDISNAFFAELTKGVERVASGQEYNVVIGNTGFDRDRGLMHLEMIRSRAVDGVIYSAGSPFTDSEIARAIGGLPLVLVDEEVPGSTAPILVSDNRDGGRLAAEHLLALGHHNALLLTATANLLSSQHRIEGFLGAWQRVSGSSATTADGGFTADGGQAATRAHIDQFLDGTRTAIFAANDEMALGALRELRAHGLAVPGQVSVMGFDDIPSARNTVPGLTTVHQDVAALGERAASVLMTILSTGERPAESRVTLPVQLVVRESTGVANQRADDAAPDQDAPPDRAGSTSSRARARITEGVVHA
ncbi:LacI family DNA-binding transcriptional regulator [Cellulomonas fimi]|uniref:LacI family transcriptional regulator n=1 Tax=Cellulomonas fimi TaxID=1708 RepID=A0A7Y0QGL3_CELFI|nr:LacI family DNA-binding transcriptional regulator [Cellulomonas fimi]NMR19218.1 LacI family transcriptional regulator [Cellulomonas fimi]